MPTFLVVDIVRVKDAAKWENYKGRVGPVVEKFGGRYVVAGGEFEVLEGSWRPTHPVVVQFASLEQARRWYGSEEYCDLKALRQAAVEANLVLIEGLA